jgi:hypothetical protein
MAAYLKQIGFYNDWEESPSANLDRLGSREMERQAASKEKRQRKREAQKKRKLAPIVNMTKFDDESDAVSRPLQ